MDGLARNSQGFGHLRPRPAGAQSPLDLGVLELIGDGPKRRHGSQTVGRAAKSWWR
jgi:hypothetical protein